MGRDGVIFLAYITFDHQRELGRKILKNGSLGMSTFSYHIQICLKNFSFQKICTIFSCIYKTEKSYQMYLSFINILHIQWLVGEMLQTKKNICKTLTFAITIWREGLMILMILTCQKIINLFSTINIFTLFRFDH